MYVWVPTIKAGNILSAKRFVMNSSDIFIAYSNGRPQKQDENIWFVSLIYFSTLMWSCTKSLNPSKPIP